MRHWARVAASEVLRTPIVPVTMIMMGCMWYAAAGIYGVVVQVHWHSEIPVLGLVGFNMLASWLLVFSFLRFAHDMRDLRLPKHRQVLTGALIIILGLIFVAPCVFVWAVHGGARDDFMVAMGSVVGTAGSLLWRSWRLRSQARSAPGTRMSAAAFAPSLALPTPARAVRIALGPPYAPASWRTRLIELVTLCAVVALVPLLVAAYENSMRPRTFTFVLHSSEFIGFLIAVLLCWVWPLYRLLAIFNPQRGTLTELALLPGMGNGRQQLRRLYLVGLGVPGAGLVVLLLSAR